jgi:alkylated DNA nucleotide flippase Atl1
MDEEYLEAVLDVADAVPPGRATTYGVIAEVLRERLGRGGPRMVGQAMARAGGAVPWWRVVNASGQPPAAYRADAVARLRAEGCPLTPGGDDDARVLLRAALWWPDEQD